MNTRREALVAALVAASITVLATAGVAALTASAPEMSRTVVDGWVSRAATGTVRPPATERGDVLSSSAERPTPTATPDPGIDGIASNYPGTAGWMGEATVALPGDLGGRYTGEVNGEVTVCADRCATFPVVDWCQCYWGTPDQRIVDLSHTAWARISDSPLAEGLIEVRVVPDS